MRKLLAPLVVSFFLIAIGPATAEACSCAPSGPPCQEVWESPLIFAGTVIDLDQSAGTLSPTRVRFRITEAFRGTEAGVIDIHLRGSMGASCDPPFKMGESWLVYANNQWEGGPGWTTSTCSRTRLLGAAGEDLEYLRLPDRQKPPGQISGRVMRRVYGPVFGEEGRDVAIAGVPVVLTRGETRLESKTDADGRYVIEVGPGEYNVEFGSVDGLDIRGGPPVSVPHYRACAIADGTVPYAPARVSGQIVDERGLPIPFLPLVLLSSYRYLDEHTLTDLNGRFELPVRNPGLHIVSPSTDLWRNAPLPIALTPSPLTVPSGGHLDTGALRLPASVRLARVELFIRDSAGTPASGADVYFREAETRNATSYDPSPQADERGRFTVSLIAGERYEFIVSHDRKTPTGTESEEAYVTIVAGGRQPVRIRLAPVRWN